MSTYRIMAVQEEGSEICLGSGIESEDDAYERLAECREKYEEYRSFSVEMEGVYTADDWYGGGDEYYRDDEYD